MAMNTRILLLSLASVVLAAPSLAEGIYKWTDDDGVTHYSDTPRAGADKVELAPVTTFSPPPPAASSGSDDADEEAEDAFEGYESIAISSPGQEETIWNTGGLVNVSVSLRPNLLPGHQLRLYMNGKPLGEIPPGATNVELRDVDRGAHTLRAAVLDQEEQVVTESEQVTFFYQQTSVNRRPGIR